MKSGRFVPRPVAASLPVSHWFSTYTAYCPASDGCSAAVINLIRLRTTKAKLPLGLRRATFHVADYSGRFTLPQ